MPSDLVHNERMKYLATLTNTVAAAALAAGVIAPLVAFSYGVPGPRQGEAGAGARGRRAVAQLRQASAGQLDAAEHDHGCRCEA